MELNSATRQALARLLRGHAIVVSTLAGQARIHLDGVPLRAYRLKELQARGLVEKTRDLGWYQAYGLSETGKALARSLEPQESPWSREPARGAAGACQCGGGS